MAAKKSTAGVARKRRRLAEAVEILKALGFANKQANDTAAYSLLAMLDLKPGRSWSTSSNPLRGITPIIEFIAEHYGARYAPNTRETIRDDAVKHFVGVGLLVRNPDDPTRPTNSGNTVYQIEPSALQLVQAFGSPQWAAALPAYLASRKVLVDELARSRHLLRVPVKLPDGTVVTLSPGGQNPLIKSVIEEFCSRYVPDGTVVYIGDTENKFGNFKSEFLLGLGVALSPAAKIPDVIVYYPSRNWLLLIEAVTK